MRTGKWVNIGEMGEHWEVDTELLGCGAEVVLCALGAATSRAEGALCSLLTREELDRASAFRRAIDRRRFVIGHGALRVLAARHLGLDSSEVPFVQDRRGSPELPGTGLECSTSHSGDLVAIAVAGGRIGVDVQHRPEETPSGWHLVAIDAELEPTGPDPNAHFLRRWTQMEAVMKVTGLGLAMPKRSRKLIRDKGLRSSYDTPFGVVHCITLELDDDHALSVCTTEELNWSPSAASADLIPEELPVLRSWRGERTVANPSPGDTRVQPPSPQAKTY